jgi:hypothetical protein
LPEIKKIETEQSEAFFGIVSQVEVSAKGKAGGFRGKASLVR